MLPSTGIQDLDTSAVITPVQGTRSRYQGTTMSKYRQPILTLFLCLLLCGTVAAADRRLKASHPDRHVVQRGDTLWDISALLTGPWRWPEIWHVNPQIQNPHLIYPGDIIELSYVDGMPRLSLRRGSLVKLSPGYVKTNWMQPSPVYRSRPFNNSCHARTYSTPVR